jgi:hypothetical protein
MFIITNWLNVQSGPSVCHLPFPSRNLVEQTPNLEANRRVPTYETFRFAVLPSSTYLFTVGVEVVYFHLITLRHTPQSV